ncbi:MAG: hypothetical protein U0N91_12235 [Oscillospiraceae bacterium]|nr:hypothetical protein [Ruminococcus sp.]
MHKAFLHSSIHFSMCVTVSPARQVDSGDGDDGFIGIPPPLSTLTGEHPINAECRREISSPLFGS